MHARDPAPRNGGNSRDGSFRWRDFGGVATPLPGTKCDRGGGVAASGGDGGGATSFGLGGSSSPALARIGGAPAAGLPELDSAPATGLVPRPGHTRRLPDRGGGTRAYAEGSTAGEGNDAPEAATPSPNATRHGSGGEGGKGGGRGNNPGTGGRQQNGHGTPLQLRPHLPRRASRASTRGRTDQGTPSSWTEASSS